MWLRTYAMRWGVRSSIVCSVMLILVISCLYSDQLPCLFHPSCTAVSFDSRILLPIRSFCLVHQECTFVCACLWCMCAYMYVHFYVRCPLALVTDASIHMPTQKYTVIMSCLSAAAWEECFSFALTEVTWFACFVLSCRCQSLLVTMTHGFEHLHNSLLECSCLL